jgi:hypothetical protein
VELQDAGLVPVKVIANDEFYFDNRDGTDASEALWLSKQRRWCQVEPLWPDEKTVADKAGDVLAKCLFDPRYTLRPPDCPRRLPDQVQHISCHYASDVGCLTLRPRPLPLHTIQVQLSALRARLTELHRPGTRQDDRQPGPFIFVNACGSGADSPKQVTSLLETLHGWTPAKRLQQ